MLQASRIGKKATTTGNEAAAEAPCTYVALIIVDALAEIKFSNWNGSEGAEIKRFLCASSTHLEARLEARVRELIAEAHVEAFDARIVLCDGGKTLRLSPLVGAEGTLFALVMEADRDDGKIARAVSRYQLTRRQTEVLGLVLGGASANDVARSLVISEYTAQGYVKCLLTKTDSRNRAEMVAKVLDWKRPASLIEIAGGNDEFRRHAAAS